MKNLFIAAAIALCCIIQPATGQPAAGTYYSPRPAVPQKKSSAKRIVKSSAHKPAARKISPGFSAATVREFSLNFALHYPNLPPQCRAFVYEYFEAAGVKSQGQEALFNQLAESSTLREVAYSSIFDYCVDVKWLVKYPLDTFVFTVLTRDLRLDEDDAALLTQHIMARYNRPNADGSYPVAFYKAWAGHPIHRRKGSEGSDSLGTETQPEEERKPEVVANKVYTYVEEMAKLPGGGGNGAIVAAIQKATSYPPLAVRNQVQGRVFVSFIVNAQGDVEDVKVVKGLGSGLDEEVARAVYQLPRFTPGKQAGKPVAVSFTVPITFKISGVPTPVP